MKKFFERLPLAVIAALMVMGLVSSGLPAANAAPVTSGDPVVAQTQTAQSGVVDAVTVQAAAAPVPPGAQGGAVATPLVKVSTQCKTKTKWRKVYNYSGGAYVSIVKVYTHPTKVKGKRALDLCLTATTAQARTADKLYITWYSGGKNHRVSTTGRKLSAKLTIMRYVTAVGLVDYFFVGRDGRRYSYYHPQLLFRAV